MWAFYDRTFGERSKMFILERRLKASRNNDYLSKQYFGRDFKSAMITAEIEVKKLRSKYGCII